MPEETTVPNQPVKKPPVKQKSGGMGGIGCLFGVLLIVLVIVGYNFFGKSIHFPSFGGGASASATVTSSNGSSSGTPFKHSKIQVGHGGVLTLGPRQDDGTVSVTLTIGGKDYHSSFTYSDGINVHRGIPFVADGLQLWFRVGSDGFEDFSCLPGMNWDMIPDKQTPCDSISWTDRDDFK